MKYTLEQRLSIGREIYTHELSVNEAAIKYEINSYTARDYMRFYRTKNGLPLMATNEPDPNSKKQSLKNMNYNNYSDLEFLSKEELIKKKEAYKDLVTILHTDQGSVYASKSFNELAQINNIIHSMSRPGTPTDNSNMEAINGWFKEELFNDFNILDSNDVKRSVEEYIYFFNNERPAYVLNYLTPKQFKEKYLL